MSAAVFDYWNPKDKEHTIHTGDPWPHEERQNVQFYAFAHSFPGVEAVCDFWNDGDKEHTFHLGEAWPNETKGQVQFYAFREQRPGTQPVFDFWNPSDKEHTFHFGEPWPHEERGHVQFYAYPSQLSWQPSAECDKILARDRAKWLNENGLAPEAAAEQVMSEFPATFGVTAHEGGHSVDGTFPHSLQIVKDGSGRSRLQISVTPRNPEAVRLIAVHYGINGKGETMHFDIRHPLPGTKTYVHVTPDFGPECEVGSEVVYWLAGLVDGLIQEMPHGACPNPEARLRWTAQ